MLMLPPPLLPMLPVECLERLQCSVRCRSKRATGKLRRRRLMFRTPYGKYEMTPVRGGQAMRMKDVKERKKALRAV